MLPLSPEICSNIAAFLSGSHKDLLSLCLTCKAFQREAEAKIYSVIVLDSPERALIACNTITCNERLALLVRTFWFSLNDRLFTANDINLGHDFWAVIQRTLIAVSNLEVLLLCDNAYTNTWIFDTPEISFHVREARLKFVWDANITNFLQSQSNLRTLLFNDPVDEVVEQLPPNSLPDLKMFDGTLSIGLQLLHTKIHHLQLVVDTEWWIENLPRFTALRRSLRSLSLLDVPEDASQRAVSIISQVLPDLRHLGIFPYPMMNRHEFYRHLMRMHNLHSLELELSRWNPAPTVQANQRSLAAELQTYCPALKIVVFWMNNVRMHWEYSDQRWQATIQPQQYQQLSGTWRLA